MNHPKRIFFGGLVTGVLLVLFFPDLMMLTGGEDRRIYRGFAAIRYQMPRSEVEKLMRSPGRRMEEFHLGQPDGFEFQYATAKRLGAAYFVSWHTGIDMTFTVAFDREDHAIYKANGGT